MINLHSKKGATLTELIIVCAVMAIIIGATATVLILGGRIFKQGADTTNAMGQTEVVEKWLQNSLSVAKKAMIISNPDDSRPENSVAFYFDAEEILHISTKGINPESTEESTELDNIREIKIKFTTDSTELSRMTASYTVDTKTGRTISGAIIMNNINEPFDGLTKETLILKNNSKPLDGDYQEAVGITIIKPTP